MNELPTKGFTRTKSCTLMQRKYLLCLFLHLCAFQMPSVCLSTHLYFTNVFYASFYTYILSKCLQYVFLHLCTSQMPSKPFLTLTYFPDAFYGSFYTSLSSMFIYCRCNSIQQSHDTIDSLYRV